LYHYGDTKLEPHYDFIHGSTKIIEKPTLAAGKKHNDYGQGFYCTKEIEVAKEWASRENSNGFVNKYSLRKSGLKVLDMQDKCYNVLNWLAILLQNRIFRWKTQLRRRPRNIL
jgi:hypothetical protein